MTAERGPAARFPRVAVMGGSLGGLTAALVLRDVGCDVRVFERSATTLEARGAGIAVLDETLRYLVERRAVAVDDVCSTTSRLRYLNADGSVRYEEPRRYRFSSWNVMYRSLLAAFDLDRYHLGAEVASFDDRGGGVTLRFATGPSAEFDLLVCADGITSGARRRLLPGVEPSYAGYVAWRGTVAESELSAPTFATLRDAITYQLLPNSHILVYPIPGPRGEVVSGRRLVNFVWYRNVAAGRPLEDLLTGRDGETRTVSLPPGAIQDRFLEELRSYAGQALAPPVAETVLRAGQPFVQVVFDIEVPAMAFGRVCLLGDAAFAARPHAAAGTAKAAADGWALAEALAATGGDVDAALAEWEPAQLDLGRRLVARVRDIGDRSQVSGTWSPGDPSLVFGLHAPGR